MIRRVGRAGRAGRAGLVVALAGLSALGCRDRREPRPAPTEPGAGAPLDAAVALPAPLDGGDDPGAEPGAAPDDDPGADDPVAGAVAVWQAVVDRDRYLARRGQSAAVHGRVGGEAIAPGARGVVRWLIDENEGNGSLGVRMAATGSVPPEGTRVVTRGAWALDSQRRWYWQVESLAPLDGPGPEAPPDPPGAPGHAITSGSPPSGYRPVSRARDGGVITFGVVRSPSSVGDGWTIADDSFSPVVAILHLPGERPSYGGHDLRQPDERWTLKRGVTYWVRIDRVRRRTADATPTIKAVTAPVKVQ